MNARRIVSLSFLTAVSALPLIACTAQDGSPELSQGSAPLMAVDMDPSFDPLEPAPPPPALTTQTLEIGDGWRKIRVFGNATDADTGVVKAVDRVLVVIQDKTKISSAPVAKFVKTGVTAELAAASTSTLSKTALAAPTVEEESTLIIDQAAADEAQAQQDSGVAMFSLCPDYDKTFQKTLSTNKTYSYANNFGSGDFTGALNVSANLVANLTGKIVVRVKRSLCVPYGVDFKYAQITGAATVKATGKVDGNFTKAFHFDKKLAQPRIAELPFSIGPIPLDIRFSAPIHIGLDGSAKADVKFDGAATGNGNFDVICKKTGCTGSKSATLGWTSGTAPTVSLSGRADVTPYAYAGIHANVYTDWIGYGEVGLKAKLKGELWGYYGNACGDADGNGVNEFVQAAVLDARGGVDLIGKAGFVGSNYGPWTYPLLDKHLAYYDLMPGGSTAASAIVTLSTPMVGGTGVEAKVKMRSCWPWDDAMKYRINWNDGSALEDTTATDPDLLATKSHSYASYGVKTVTATPIVDNKGRGPGKAGSDTINLQPVIFQQPVFTSVLMK